MFDTTYFVESQQRVYGLDDKSSSLTSYQNPESHSKISPSARERIGRFQTTTKLTLESISLSHVAGLSPIRDSQVASGGVRGLIAVFSHSRDKWCASCMNRLAHWVFKRADSVIEYNWRKCWECLTPDERLAVKRYYL